MAPHVEASSLRMASAPSAASTTGKHGAPRLKKPASAINFRDFRSNKRATRSGAGRSFESIRCLQAALRLDCTRLDRSPARNIRLAGAPMQLE
jgi:hypothetical protein